MQVQQSLALMRQAVMTLFRPPGQAEGSTFRPAESIEELRQPETTRAAAETRSAEAGPSLRKGSAPLPTGVIGFIAERFTMPESTLGLPKGYFIDIQV